MKKNYHFMTKLIPQGYTALSKYKSMKLLSLIVLSSLFTQLSFAQTSINWTGAISSDAAISENWDPQLTPFGNRLYVDTAKKYINLPVLNADTNSSIFQISQEKLSRLEINVGEGYTIDVNGKDASILNFYEHGSFYSGGKGKLTFRGNVYQESPDDSIFVTDGTFEVRSALLMGMKDLSTGGYLFISNNANVHLRKFPQRFSYPSTTTSMIKITDNGTMTVVGDFSTDADSLINITGQICSSPDRDIVCVFDPLTNITTIYSRDKMAFLAEPAEHQYLAAGTDGEIIRIVKNDGWKSMNSFVWKYSTTSGSGYMDFASAQTGDTLVPHFANSGVYYVVCIGDNGTTTDTTNQVTFIVSSDKVSIAPDGIQILKLGQTPVPLVVTETETATSREWLYTNVPGEAYKSFDPAITDSFCAPLFDETGEYYIICRSIISGQNEQSSEVQINVTDSSTRADLRWKGTISSDANDPLNWSPYAYLYKNNMIFDTSEYKTNECILTGEGDEIIGEIDIRAGASFTIDKPEADSVIGSGSDADWLFGTFNIKSGIFYDKVFFHIKDKTGVLNVSGGVFSSKYDLLVGNGSTATAGGYVNIYGTGVIDVPGVDRFCATDSTQSVVTIWDDGKLITHDNDTTFFKDKITNKQLQTLEGWELVITYNPSDTTTIITAFDPNAIYVTPTAKQTLAIDEMASVLSASNTAIYDSLIWKYSTSIGGALIAFEPAINDTFAKPSFSAAGSYYVVCVGMNDTLTKVSNSVQIIVPDVAVSPAEKQVVLYGVPSVELEVSDSPEAASVAWKYSGTTGGPYSAMIPPITSRIFAPNFPSTGTYYVICEATYGTKAIISNEVEVEVVDIQLAPSGNQTISVNTDGTTITATETGSIDSREWMYTTTSGEGYTSFNPAVTGSEYTPNFASEGTYFVICASVFSGVTIYSDEVAITVSGNPGIKNTEMNNLVVYPNPTTGKFVIQEEITGKFRVDVFNSQGKLVLSEEYNGLEGLQEFSLDNKGLYIINLVTTDYTKTTKLIVE